MNRNSQSQVLWIVIGATIAIIVFVIISSFFVSRFSKQSSNIDIIGAQTKAKFYCKDKENQKQCITEYVNCIKQGKSPENCSKKIEKFS